MAATERPQQDEPAYRVFFLDDDGKVVSQVDLPDVHDDQTAISEARAMRYIGVRELWDGPRLVRRFQETIE